MKLRSKRREKVFAVLPTLLTLGNAVCGFGAITFAARWTGYDLATSLFAAACLIYLAMLFDALDGSAARWTNQTSEFGAQLDSLCDAISFGAAPAFLMLQFSTSFGYPLRLLWLIAALYVVCTVLRLARFNVETDEDDAHGYFKGLPSPGAAGAVASFPIMVFGLKQREYVEQDIFWEGFADRLDAIAVAILPLVTFAVACLMVSRVRYIHVFQQFLRGRRNRRHLIRLVFALAIIFVVPQVSAPLLFCWYAFGSPSLALWERGVRKWAAYRGVAPPPAAVATPAAPPPAPVPPTEVR
jgi:CDP-diacylglycerol--serine O-phosphatidyltransferase